MKLLLISLTIGILLGWMLKRIHRVHYAVLICKLTMPSLYLFLIAIGVTVGANQEIIDNLSNVVAKAGVLAIGSILGSVLLAQLGRRFMTSCVAEERTGYGDANNGKTSSENRSCLGSCLQALRASLVVFGSFLLGVALGVQSFMAIDPALTRQAIINLFCILMFTVGVGSGSDDKLISVIKKAKPSICVLPLLIICGTFLGTFLLSPLLPGVSATQAVGVGAGLGYYSLSSLMISNLANPMLGAIALLANLFREVLTIGFGPLLVKLFGPVGLIASGGSSSCSVVLPTVTVFAGKGFVPVAVMSGLILELAVPLLITLVFMVF